VAVEEQEVFKYNEGLNSPERPTQPPADWLDSVFPAGPSLVADHPYVVLNAPWVNDAKVRIATAFLKWLQSGAQQSRFTEEGFRDYNDLAHPPLTNEIGMTGYHPAARLSLSSAAIAAIRDSWPKVRRPASVSIVLDLAARPDLAAIRNSVGELENRDQVAVWAVANAQLKPIWDPTSLDPAGRTQILKAINSAPIATAPGRLYLTIKSAYELLGGSPGSADINAIVIITSYRDDGSGGSLSALERDIGDRSRATPFRIYSVSLKGSDSIALLGIEKASGGVANSWSDPASAVRACLGNF
jgi:Ca-activated chloride channel family protein